MKCLVQCKIWNIGGGRREVSFPEDDYAKVWSTADVPASACRMPDGSPIPEDWPPMKIRERHSLRPDGLVEAVVKDDPGRVAIDLGENYRADVRPESVRLEGTAGKPAYRLAIVGRCP